MVFIDFLCYFAEFSIARSSNSVYVCLSIVEEIINSIARVVLSRYEIRSTLPNEVYQ